MGRARQFKSAWDHTSTMDILEASKEKLDREQKKDKKESKKSTRRMPWLSEAKKDVISAKSRA